MKPWMWIVSLLQVAICAGLLWTTPAAAAELYLSDSAEYSIAGQRLAQGKGLTVSINGEAHPIRYPPGLPLITAAFHSLGIEGDGIAILFIWLTAVFSVILTQHLGRRMVPGLAGGVTGCLAVGGLMSHHFFVDYSQRLMGTAPMLCLAVLITHVLFSAWTRPTHRLFLVGGLLVALGMSLRITFAACAVPFAVLALRESGTRMLRLTQAAVFPVLMLLALCMYNASLYGGPFFTGYHYWLRAQDCSLSLNYLGPNLWAVWDPFSSAVVPSVGNVVFGGLAVAVAIVGLVLASRHRVPGRVGQPVLLFLLTGALPISVFHLFYPFASSRFHLMAYVALFALAAAAWVPWLLARANGRGQDGVRAGLLALSLGLSVLGPYFAVDRGYSFKLEFAAAANQALPADAVLIAGFNAVHLEHLMNRQGRRILLPLVQPADYATMRVGRKGERRRPVFPLCPPLETESPDDLVALARSRRVFMELLTPWHAGRQALVKKLGTRFRFEPFLKVRNTAALVELKVR